MPNPAERAGRRRRVGDRGRVLLVAALVLIVGLIISARFFAGFYVDYLWHTSLGRGDVFWGILRTKVLLFVLFAGAFSAMAILNLLIADRLSPVVFTANVHPAVERFHDFFGRRLRLFRIVVAVVIGMLFAAPAIGRWQEWLMFRNSKSFGFSDPQFHHDIGFYLFKLPFVTFLLDWLFAALIFITLLTVATHILNGGIIFSPPRPKVRNSAKAHIAALLAALALVKAASYWVERYELTAENRSNIVRGATYTTVHASLPAIVLLGLIALLTAGTFLSTLKTGSWRLPIVASGLWAVMALVGGIIYPAVIQALVVDPNQREREAPYIERNVLATLHALGIDQVDRVNLPINDLSTAQVTAGSSSLQNARLLKADADMVSRFRSDEGLRAGLTINDLDIDRYVIDGRQQQVVLGARELDLSSVANKTWQGKHLISTHGCGLVVAPAGQVDSNGRPVYSDATLARPELYFSDDISGYAIVNTAVGEETCPGQADPGAYSGTGGVKLDSVFKRLAFALDYLDYNLIGSSAINDGSRLISVRRIQDRVRSLAPFLQFDGDPYPVELDGRVLWVVDGYTTSDLYPYGQNGDRSQLTSSSGLTQPFNYIRNSVKAVVDAYDGTTTFYEMDSTDPVLKVWESAFPGLFRSSLGDAGGTCRAPPLPRGAVPRPDRGVLQVPAAAEPVLRSQRGVVGRPGAAEPGPGDDGGHGHRDTGDRRQQPAAGVLRRVRFGEVRAVLLDVPGARADDVDVRAVPPVRAVQHQRRSPRAPGVHDREQRSSHLRAVDRLHGDRRSVAERAAAGRQHDGPGSVDLPAGDADRPARLAGGAR
ncbi:MAG: UPF0182 family protein [Ilumatobacteraceae bacterium]